MIEGQLYNLLIIQTIGPLITDVIKNLIGEHKSALTEWITVNTVFMLITGYYVWKYKCDIKYIVNGMINKYQMTYKLEGIIHYSDNEILYHNGFNIKAIKYVMYYIINVIKPEFSKNTAVHVNVNKSSSDNIQIYKLPNSFQIEFEGETIQLNYNEQKDGGELKIRMVIKASNYDIIDNLINTSYEYHNANVDNIDTDKYKDYIYMVANQNRFITYNQYNYNNDITFDELFLNEKDTLMNHLTEFKEGKSKHKFISLLLHGKPGTGKTSIIRMMANYFNRSVVYIKLNEIKNMQTLLEVIHSEEYEITGGYENDFNTVNIGSNKIIVFEDIDACCENLIKKRNSNLDDNDANDNSNINSKKANKKKMVNNRGYVDFEDENTLTFDDILNALNGVIPNNDLIFVMTTNHVNKIDNALTRPGRITLNLELNEIKKDTISLMIHKYYPEISMDVITEDVKLNEIIPCILENIIKNTTEYNELISILNDEEAIKNFNLKYEN